LQSGIKCYIIGVKWDEVGSVHNLSTETNMLIGEYRHTIDPKKRLSMPAKFREEMGKKVVATRGLENCLFVYPIKEWKEKVEKIMRLPMGQADSRGFSRFMLAGAVETEVDSLGRILIPDFLRDFAKLKGTVAVIGVGERVEIWDTKAWDAYKKKVEKQADALAEKLGSVGAI